MPARVLVTTPPWPRLTRRTLWPNWSATASCAAPGLRDRPETLLKAAAAAPPSATVQLAPRVSEYTWPLGRTCLSLQAAEKSAVKRLPEASGPASACGPARDAPVPAPSTLAAAPLPASLLSAMVLVDSPVQEAMRRRLPLASATASAPEASSARDCGPLSCPARPSALPAMPAMPATVAATQPLGETVGVGVSAGEGEVLGEGVGVPLVEAPGEGEGEVLGVGEAEGHCTRRRPWLSVSHTRRA